MLSCFSCVQLFGTLWTEAHQSPLSMGFSRQEHQSGLPFPPSADLPSQGSNLPLFCLLHWQADSFITRATWEACMSLRMGINFQELLDALFSCVFQYSLLLFYVCNNPLNFSEAITTNIYFKVLLYGLKSFYFFWSWFLWSVCGPFPKHWKNFSLVILDWFPVLIFCTCGHHGCLRIEQTAFWWIGLSRVPQGKKEATLWGGLHLDGVAGSSQ